MVTLALTAGAVAIGGSGLATAWVTRRAEASSSLRLVMGATLAAGVAITTVVGVAVLGGRIDGFGVMHHLYLAVTVSLPMVGAGLLLNAGRRARRAPARALGLALLVPGLVGIYATHVEPARLRVEHVTVAIDAARAGDDPVRIAVLADLQTNRVGDHERRAIDEVLAARPDLILLPGDLFQGRRSEFEDELPALQSQLARLRAPHGVFFVRGDVDHGDFADRALAGTGVRILDGEVVEVSVGDRQLRIGGHALDFAGSEAERTRADLLGAAGDGAVAILLAHRPDTVLHLPTDSEIDLTVAGHTHGGQVVVPVFGPLVTMTEVPRAVARGGLHHVAGNRIYVSPGVGMERGQAPQVRLFSPPTVGILSLAG